MITDATLLPHRVRLGADVVVVGAGPAGLTLAQELASSGLHVIVAEAGGRHHARVDDDANHGVVAGDPFPMTRSRQRGFGGTSGHWTPATGLRVRPLDPIDLAPIDGRPSSWPFGIDELTPFYARALAGIGIDPADAEARWRSEGLGSSLAWPGGPQLAGFQFASHDAFTRRFDAVAADRRIRLVLRAPVSSVLIGADGATVERVVASPGGSSEVTFVGRTVVLAAGAIENARILLSSPGRTGAGLGNETDNVGRYFMDHLSFDCAVLDPRSTSLDVASFAEPRVEGRRLQAMLWLGEECIRREGLLNAAFWLTTADAAYFRPGVHAARAVRHGWDARRPRQLARDAVRAVAGSRDLLALAVRSRTGRTVPQHGLRILAEQTPRRDSRVLLSQDRDRNGMRRAVVDWRISDADLDSMRRHIDLLGRMLDESGRVRVRQTFEPLGPADPPVMTNYHHLGSTRMHGDPRHGVVDADLRVHTVPNLFVLGGSVMPAGGYVNPTLTILALAHRLADALVAEHGPTRAVAPVR